MSFGSFGSGWGNDKSVDDMNIDDMGGDLEGNNNATGGIMEDSIETEGIISEEINSTSFSWGSNNNEENTQMEANDNENENQQCFSNQQQQPQPKIDFNSLGNSLGSIMNMRMNNNLQNNSNNSTSGWHHYNNNSSSGWVFGSMNDHSVNTSLQFASNNNMVENHRNDNMFSIEDLYWGSDYEYGQAEADQSFNAFTNISYRMKDKKKPTKNKPRNQRQTKQFEIEFDTSLPDHWNVIKKRKTKRDPLSKEFFGTIQYQNPKTSYSNESNQRGNSFTNIGVNNQFMRHNPNHTHPMTIRTASELQSADNIRKNRYYLNNYNFTNYIVDNNTVRQGILMKTSTLTVPKISMNINERDSDDSGGESNDIDAPVNVEQSQSANDIESGCDSDNMGDDGENVEEDQNGWFVATDKDMEQDRVADEENELYMNAQDLSKEEKEEQYAGEEALDEIRKYQRTTKLLIDKDEFQSFVGNIIYNNDTYSKDVTIQSNAMAALQEAAEDHIVRLFEYANLMAINSERQNVNETDVQAVIKLLKKRTQKLQLDQF